MDGLAQVQDELATTLEALDPRQLSILAAAFDNRGRRWFVSGQGRSRLVASMAAMRLMHVGFDVHLVGEVTTPAIGDGDGLLMLSASGETPVSVHLARRANEVGAHVFAITTRPDSTLAALAEVLLCVPVKHTAQFGGSLFEQASLLLLDALVADITRDDATAHDAMSKRHTNLE